MSRELTSWLDSYLEYTENTESPTSYHQWCGLSVIAGALQRRVYLRWGLDQIIYPNLYVVLIGPSGRTRKGMAIGIGKSFLKSVPHVTVTPESSSGRQAMILCQKRALRNFNDPTKGNKIEFHSAVTAFSEELAVFLGQGDIAYLASLTDWYDSKDDWEYETVGRGKDSLQGLCLNFLGGTAPDWIQSMIPQEALGGGFTSRIIFVVEEKKKKIVPKHIITEREWELHGKLTRDLERIALLAGEITFSPAAEQLYTSWYVEQDTKLANKESPVSDNRFAGYCERRATHLRKLMLICSASRGDDLVIQKEDFDRAWMLLQGAEVNMHKTFGGLGKARNSDSIEQVMNFIKDARITTRTEIMRRFFRDIDLLDYNKIEETLEIVMKVIKVARVRDSESGDLIVSYTWVG